MHTRVYAGGGPKKPQSGPTLRRRGPVPPRQAGRQQELIAHYLAERQRERTAGTVRPIVNAGALLGTLAIAHTTSLAKNVVAALVIAEGVLRTVLS